MQIKNHHKDPLLLAQHCKLHLKNKQNCIKKSQPKHKQNKNNNQKKSKKKGSLTI